MRPTRAPYSWKKQTANASYRSSHSAITADVLLEFTIRSGEGIIGDLASRGAAEVVNDVLSDPRGVPIAGTEEDEEERLMAAPSSRAGASSA